MQEPKQTLPTLLPYPNIGISLFCYMETELWRKWITTMMDFWTNQQERKLMLRIFWITTILKKQVGVLISELISSRTKEMLDKWISTKISTKANKLHTVLGLIFQDFKCGIKLDIFLKENLIKALAG